VAVVRGYRPDLDGIRALGVLQVMAYHFEAGGFKGAAVTVDLFFALSGYLITGLLLAERAEFGRVRLREFYLRRFFRLVPALLMMVTVGGIALGVALPGNRDHALVVGGLIAALYLTDIASYGHSTLWATYVWTWTLSVEEQFYLLWPTVLRGAGGSMRRTRQVTFGLVIVSLVLAEVTAHNGTGGVAPLDYYQPQAHAFSLILGSAAAMVEVPRWFRHLALPALVALLALGWFSPLILTATYLRLNSPAAAIATVVLMLALEHDPRIAKAILSFPVMVRIGVISYGLYLYHSVVYVVIENQTHRAHWAIVVASFAISFVAAELSYRFYESPIRRYGRDWIARRYHHPQPARVT
jgi:peptidoglycan/LPS O-acetylase OafA/YrhL